MSEATRRQLIHFCIMGRAEIEGIVPELLGCKEYMREKTKLEQLSDEELGREYDWVCELKWDK